MNQTISITVTGGVEHDFEALSFFGNELENAGIQASLRTLDPEEAALQDRIGNLHALLREAMRLMPLGNRKRAEWLSRAASLVSIDPLEIAMIPVLSIEHLESSTKLMLHDEGDRNPWCSCGSYEFGFFLSVPNPDHLPLMGPGAEPPADLLRLWNWARGEGYMWLQFDTDGDRVMALPVFDSDSTGERAKLRLVVSPAEVQVEECDRDQ